jgi:hypothetical protein
MLKYNRPGYPAKRRRTWRYAMSVALEINFALWVMLGCAATKAAQFAQYLT